MGIFKKRKIKKEKVENKKAATKMFGELTLEEFKSKLLMLYKQECALDDDNTYFEPQDNLFGEMFDNAVRIKFIKAENEQFEGQYDDEELKAEAKRLYEEDKAKAEDNKKGEE